MTKIPLVDLDEEEIKRQAMGNINLYIPEGTMPQNASVSPSTNSPATSGEKPASTQDRPKKPTKPVVKEQLPDDYDALFLVPNPGSSRCQTYIDRRHYDLIKRYLAAIAPAVSIAGYINNVLGHHIEQYWDRIEKLYNQESIKPLKK